MTTIFQYFKSIIFFFFGLFLLWVAMKDIDFIELNKTINRIPLKWVFLSMLLGYLAFVFRGLRWFLLIKPLGYNPSRWSLIHSIAFGYLFNSFIPRSGELMRCTALNKVTAIPVSRLFGHVLLERLIDFILLFLFICLACVLNYHDFMIFFDGFTFSINILLYLLVAVLFLIVCYKIGTLMLTQSQSSYISSFIDGIKTGFMSIKKIEQKFLFSIYTLLIWVCYLFMTVVCFYCFSETIDLSLAQGLFIMIAGGLGMVIPTPTGIGSYHYLVIKALMVINISREIAQFFALIVHTSQAIMIITTGFLAMIVLYNQKKHND